MVYYCFCELIHVKHFLIVFYSTCYPLASLFWVVYNQENLIRLTCLSRSKTNTKAYRMYMFCYSFASFKSISAWHGLSSAQKQARFLPLSFSKSSFANGFLFTHFSNISVASELSIILVSGPVMYCNASPQPKTVKSSIVL